MDAIGSTELKDCRVFLSRKRRSAILREDIEDALAGRSPRKERVVRGELLWYTTFARLLVCALLNGRHRRQRVAVHHRYEEEFGLEVIECVKEKLAGRCSVEIEFEMIPREFREQYHLGYILTIA